MATTSWSNQLTRLFNAPLDRESVFDTMDALLAFLQSDEIAYEGQIVAVVNATFIGATQTKDPILNVYVLEKDQTGTNPDAVVGANGNRWLAKLLASADATINNAGTADKLTTARNIKLKDAEGFIDGDVGVDFDGSADIEIPVKLVDQPLLKDIGDASVNPPAPDTFTKVQVNKKGIVVKGYETIDQADIVFDKDNKFADLGIIDGMDSLDDVSIGVKQQMVPDPEHPGQEKPDLDPDGHPKVTGTALTDKDVLQYNDATKKWENKTLADAGISDSKHTHALNDLSDVNTTGVGDSDNDAKFPLKKTIVLYSIADKQWHASTLRDAGIFDKSEYVTQSPGAYVPGEDSSVNTSPSYYSGKPIVLNSFGKIDTSLLPPMALTKVYQCATPADMLAFHKTHNVEIGAGTTMVVEDTSDPTVLTPQPDGTSIHVKVPKTYMYAGADVNGSTTADTVISDWIELSETGTVVSVNGKQGTVMLDALDVNGVPLLNGNRDGATTPDQYARVKVNKFGLVESGDTKLEQKYMVFNTDNKLKDLGIVDILDAIDDVTIGKKPVMVDDGTNTGNLVQKVDGEGNPVFVGKDVADKDVLSYDANTEQWMNKSLSELDAKAVLEREITVQLGVNGAVGGVKTGDVLAQGMTLQKVLEKILIKPIAYVYTKPSLNLNINKGEVEVGTNITDLVITDKLNDRGADGTPDAGPVTSHVITVNGTNVLNTTTMNKNVDVRTNATIASVNAGNNPIVSKVTYSDGAPKNNNLGDPTPITANALGATLTQQRNIVGYRYIFWYQATGKGTAPATSNDVRTNATGKQFEKTLTFNINVVAGQQTFWVACPSNRTLKSVIAVNQSNAEIMGNFVHTTASVEGANGFAAANYNIYTYIPNAAFGNADILKITLK